VGCCKILKNEEEMEIHMQQCTCQGECVLCGTEFNNSITIGGGDFKRSTKMHLTHKQHIQRNMEKAKIKKCTELGCDREVKVLACANK
jgi:hypothetical protein